MRGASAILRAVLTRFLCAGVLLAAALAGCGDEPLTIDDTPKRDEGPYAYDRDTPGGLRLAPTRFSTRREKVELISFRAPDGDKVTGLIATPRRIREPRRCVINQGGLGATPTASQVLWPAIAKADAATVTIGARYHGDRARRGVDAKRAARSPALLERMLRLTVIDLRRLVDLLHERDLCRSIAYVGGSLGGIYGAPFVGVDRRVAGAVLMISGGDWRKLLRGTDVLLPRIERDPDRFREAVDLLAPIDPVRWVGDISPRPLLLITAREDQVIVPVASEALEEAAGAAVETFQSVGGHAIYAAPDKSQVLARISRFTREVLDEAEAKN